MFDSSMQMFPPWQPWFNSPLLLSHGLLSLFNVRFAVHYAERIPAQGCFLVVSNHRSFLDTPLIMQGLNRTVHFACHRYLSQVPLVREVVLGLGCFPLATRPKAELSLFRQATALLKQNKLVGLFPEGAMAMTTARSPQSVVPFQRGFAHLGLRSPPTVRGILPIAIAAHTETQEPAVPLHVLSAFDPTEPLFRQQGCHPVVLYRQVSLIVGQPLWLTLELRRDYRGTQGKAIAQSIAETCQGQITDLLHQGCY